MQQAAVLMQYRIAYQGETAVNWCPVLGTVLANDEVKEGYSVRGGHPVEQKKMTQWQLRVSAYAGRLLEDLEDLDDGNLDLDDLEIWEVGQIEELSFTLQIDYMERNTNVNNAFENFSVMGEFSYLIADRVNLFARATYDHCSEDFVPMADLCIFPGTELTRVGGGVEYYPLGGRGNRSIRLHAACSYTFGNNTNPAGTALDKQTFVDFGLTWRLDILNAIKQVFCSKKQCE